MLGTASLSFTLWRVGEVMVSDLLFLAAAAIIILKLLTGNDGDLAPPAQRKGSPLILVGAILLLTAGTLSSLRSWYPVDSISVVLRFGWVTLVWFWIMRTVCRDRDDLNLLIRAWKFSSIITAIAAVLGQMGIAFVSTHLGDRQTGLTGHPNHLAGQLAATFMFFLLAVPRRDGANSGSSRLPWLVALGLSTTAIFASGSMSGLVAILGGMLVVGVVYLTTSMRRTTARRRSPLAPMLAIVVVGAGAVALFTSDLAVVDRLTRFRDGDTYVEESVGSRGDRNSLVTERFDQYLVVGLGFHTGYPVNRIIDADDPSARDYGVHNMHLGILYQAGLAASVGVIVILVTAGRQLKGLLRRTDEQLYSLTLALIGSFVTVNVISLFQPTAFDRYFWMPVALTGCLWSVRRSELRADNDDGMSFASVPRAIPPQRAVAPPREG